MNAKLERNELKFRQAFRNAMYNQDEFLVFRLFLFD